MAKKKTYNIKDIKAKCKAGALMIRSKELIPTMASARAYVGITKTCISKGKTEGNALYDIGEEYVINVVEQHIETILLNPESRNVVGSIFYAKAVLGLRDNQEIDNQVVQISFNREKPLNNIIDITEESTSSRLSTKEKNGNKLTKHKTNKKTMKATKQDDNKK